MALIMSVKGKNTTSELSERNNKISHMKEQIIKTKAEIEELENWKTVRCINLKALNFFQ